jgi:hypothetical protein
MASSDPDRNRNISASQDKAENPFIRFRRFADAQIGAVLQGIIGLPSVFSKPPHDANARWTDLNDDLKRRERRQAEQQAGELNNRATSDDDELEIPLKKFRGWSPPPTSLDRSRIPSGMEDESDRDATDLFTPITKALFAHLNRSWKDDVDWSPTRLDAGPMIFDPRFCNHLDMPKLREDQKSGDVLNMIQSMVYDDLNMTAKRTLCRHFHSQRSVLPYLLFSPYSPLALADMPPPRKAAELSSPYIDEFPYCAAFEDLLLHSQGRPMGYYVLAPSESFQAIKRANRAMFGNVSKEVRRANAGMSWLNAMHIYGLLSSEEASVSRLPFGSDMSLPVHTKFIPTKEFNERFGPKKPQLQEDAQTEQDMYEELERHVPPEARDLVKEIHNAQQLVRNTIDSMLFGEAPTKSSGGAENNSQKSTATQTEPLPNQAPELGIESVIGRVLDMLEKRSEADWPSSRKDDRVLPAGGVVDTPDNEVMKTTTTTSQTTHADGMIDTIVTVKKVYADGSVSVKETRSSKAATPVQSAGHDGFRDDDDDYYDNGAEWTGEDRAENKEGKDKNEKKSKGWFWN